MQGEEKGIERLLWFVRLLFQCHYPFCASVWLLILNQNWEAEKCAREPCSCQIESLLNFPHLWSDPFRLREQNSGSDTPPPPAFSLPFGSTQLRQFPSSPVILLSKRSKERDPLASRPALPLLLLQQGQITDRRLPSSCHFIWIKCIWTYVDMLLCVPKVQEGSCP